MALPSRAINNALQRAAGVYCHDRDPRLSARAMPMESRRRLLPRRHVHSLHWHNPKVLPVGSVQHARLGRNTREAPRGYAGPRQHGAEAWLCPPLRQTCPKDQGRRARQGKADQPHLQDPVCNSQIPCQVLRFRSSPAKPEPQTSPPALWHVPHFQAAAHRTRQPAPSLTK